MQYDLGQGDFLWEFGSHGACCLYGKLNLLVLVRNELTEEFVVFLACLGMLVACGHFDEW